VTGVVLGFTNFIAQNPGFAVWMIGILVSMVGSMALGAWLVLSKQHHDLKAEVVKLEDRVTEVEVLLGHSSIMSISDRLNEVMRENTTAHAEIAGCISTMETRLGMLEKNSPNGKLDEALRILQVLMGRNGRA
jgi:hypothetical protein